MPCQTLHLHAKPLQIKNMPTCTHFHVQSKLRTIIYFTRGQSAPCARKSLKTKHGNSGTIGREGRDKVFCGLFLQLSCVARLSCERFIFALARLTISIIRYLWFVCACTDFVLDFLNKWAQCRQQIGSGAKATRPAAQKHIKGRINKK